MDICTDAAAFADFLNGQVVPVAFPDDDCMSNSVTQLTVLNNSFNDSEQDGISTFAVEASLNRESDNGDDEYFFGHN